MNIDDRFAVHGSLLLQPSSVEGAGIGLFTTMQIPMGQPICEYKGDVLTLDEVNARYSYTVIKYGFPSSKALYGVVNHYNAPEKSTPQIIDCHPAMALNPIGYGGFINDKYGYGSRVGWKYNPNESFDSLKEHKKELLDNGYNAIFQRVPKANVVLIMGLRDLNLGEEIFLDYGEGYWKEEDWIPVIKKMEEKGVKNLDDLLKLPVEEPQLKGGATPGPVTLGQLQSSETKAESSENKKLETA
jgi:hypothetical protein